MLIHGDVYRSNVLWRAREISGLVDWDELNHGFRGQELARTVREFRRDVSGTMLAASLARGFPPAYGTAGGVVATDFADDATHFIRRRLRQEYRSALRGPGLVERDPYHAAESVALWRLRGWQLQR